MGYTTSFSGEWYVEPALTKEQVRYINAFNATRRVGRNPEVAGSISDPIREAAGLPLGVEAGYYVATNADRFEAETTGVIDANHPPKGQPGLWCQWEASSDGMAIRWDGGEKFYDYIDWIAYLIEHFFARWERKLTGDIYWAGEDDDDRGIIRIKDNVVKVLHGHVEYREAAWQ